MNDKQNDTPRRRRGGARKGPGKPRSPRRGSGGSRRGGGGSGKNNQNDAGRAAAAKLTSPQNPQVKNLVKLRHRRARDESRQTVVEEPLVLRRAWESGYPLEAVYYCPELLTDPARELLEDLQAAVRAGQMSLDLIELAPALLRKAAYRDQPEGMLAVAPQQTKQLTDLVLKPDSLLVVLENVEKPGNLGAALRVADGVGADAVLVTGEGTDLYNPNVLRASRGAFFSVPAVECHVGEARDFLHEAGVKVVVTTPDASQVYTDVDLTGPTAIILGCEHNGLSQAWLNDEGAVPVRIPMQGRGDSLNVSTAAAILLYEAIRQRSAR